MILRLLYFGLLFSIFESARGFDPFEGTQPIVQCLTCRHSIGCNKTLLQAYKETELSKTDNNINEADTKFYLFTRRNERHPECLHLCGGSLPGNTYFDPSKTTIVVVGGHLSSVCTFKYFLEFKIQLLFRDDFNVILVDWYWGNGPDIFASMWNTKVVGKQLAFLILKIREATGVNICKNIMIIGHAYGAHIGGYAGRFAKDSDCKIAKIKALDPFGGAFNVAHEDDRLDPSDANHVEVIHTGAGDCFPFSLGTNLKLGHADFYPNGGSVQPSCIPDAVHAFLKGDFVVGALSLWPAACYLFRSIRYFMVSINPCRNLFIGVQCKNYEEFKSGKCKSCGQNRSKCAVMGFDYENYAHPEGNYSFYLDTNKECPYFRDDDIDLGDFRNITTRNSSQLHCFEPRKDAKSK